MVLWSGTSSTPSSIRELVSHANLAEENGALLYFYNVHRAAIDIENDRPVISLFAVTLSKRSETIEKRGHRRKRSHPSVRGASNLQ